MQIHSMSLAACAALILATPAAAQTYRSEARLAAPAAAPAAVTVSGVSWRCEAEFCIGTAQHRTIDSFMKECRRTAEAVGPLASFASRGRAMSPRDVATCNRLAGKTVEAESALAEK
ncbi:MAG: CC_3452 family protein [Phenylobacterium sp.]|uniref:CC_3452 family protein n=1 Tax=Phenylobacterium sp. TaxID=1871053 RepID=UPI003918B6AA